MKFEPTPYLSQQFREELPLIAAAVRSPLPYFLAAGCAVWAGEHTGQNVTLTLAYTLFAYLLSLLAVIDLRKGILPHTLTLPLLLLGTILAPTLGITYWESTLGSFITFGGLFLCGMLAERASGQPALGGGDLWLIMALGAWLGVGGLPMLLLATAVTGLISICIRNWLNGGFPAQKTFPFGPALCAAGWLALLYAPYYWRFMEMLTSSSS